VGLALPIVPPWPQPAEASVRRAPSMMLRRDLPGFIIFVCRSG
jgi:hypothetical protein